MNRVVLALIAAVGVSFCIFLGLYLKDSPCDKKVELVDGEVIQCRSFTSTKEGTTHIKLCDGEKIVIPTVRIKQMTYGK